MNFGELGEIGYYAVTTALNGGKRRVAHVWLPVEWAASAMRGDDQARHDVLLNVANYFQLSQLPTIDWSRTAITRLPE